MESPKEIYNFMAVRDMSPEELYDLSSELLSVRDEIRNLYEQRAKEKYLDGQDFTGKYIHYVDRKKNMEYCMHVREQQPLTRNIDGDMLPLRGRLIAFNNQTFELKVFMSELLFLKPGRMLNKDEDYSFKVLDEDEYRTTVGSFYDYSLMNFLK